MLKNPNLSYIKNLYTNKKLKKIVNVFQKQYINIKGQGFGDFIRGSIYLTYISIILDLDFDINLKNHPISEFFEIYDSSYNICYSNIEAFIDYNDNEQKIKIIKEFIQKLNNCDEEVYYLYNNFIPLFNIENQVCIIQKARDIIIPKIEPKKYVLDILDNKLENCGLTRNNYAVIHIRCGDYFMHIKKNIDTIKHKISSKHINDIVKIINKQCNKEKKYIIIGDSNEIKQYVSSKFSNIIMFNSKITHLGEDENNDGSAILETLIDFNIMRYSNFIISFSAYGHGSGFSKYCASIYNVPFNQIILQPLLQYKI